MLSVEIRDPRNVGAYELFLMENGMEIGLGDGAYYDREMAERAADELLCRALAQRELEAMGEKEAAGIARYPELGR